MRRQYYSGVVCWYRGTGRRKGRGTCRTRQADCLAGQAGCIGCGRSPTKTIVLPGKLAASMAAARAKPKEPETLQPEVKQAAAPQIKTPLGPSPEVHAPGVRA
jgi:hypothetical protein